MKAVRKLSVIESRLLDIKRLGCPGKRTGEAAGDTHS